MAEVWRMHGIDEHVWFSLGWAFFINADADARKALEQISPVLLLIIAGPPTWPGSFLIFF